MIHYYQKPVVRGAISETWLNEQASEVAEDLIADRLMIDGPRAIAYDDPGAGEPENRSGRLPGYNLYNDIQVSGWDGYLANYSINYAFGAYLARNYGGAALFSDIVQSDRHGVSAIEGAVRNQGHDASFLELLVNWGGANLLSDNNGRSGAVSVQHRTLARLPCRRHPIPPRLHQPLQLRLRPRPLGSSRSVSASVANVQRTHSAASLQPVYHPRAQHRDRPACASPPSPTAASLSSSRNDPTTASVQPQGEPISASILIDVPRRSWRIPSGCSRLRLGAAGAESEGSGQRGIACFHRHRQVLRRAAAVPPGAAVRRQAVLVRADPCSVTAPSVVVPGMHALRG